jgi:hypothetical protein
VKGNSSSKETSTKKNASKSSSNFFLNIIIAVLSLLILFLGYALVFQIAKSFDNEEVTEQKIILPSQVQIEVLNGCGAAGIADGFTEFLRAEGFDVVNKGNYSSFDVDNTLVIDRSNNPDKANMVAEAVGLEKKRIVKQFNNQYFLDVSLIIGKDYNTLLINK